MESQFGIAHVWTQGDFVTRAVAVILLTMSVASWLVIVLKALDIMKFKKFAKSAPDFWHSADLASGLEKLGDDNDEDRRFSGLHHGILPDRRGLQRVCALRIYKIRDSLQSSKTSRRNYGGIQE